MDKQLFKIAPRYDENGIKHFDKFEKDILLEAKFDIYNDFIDVLNELKFDDFYKKLKLYGNNINSYYEKIAKEYDIDTKDLQKNIKDDFINYKILGKFSAFNDETKQLLICKESNDENSHKNCSLWDINKDKKPILIYDFKEAFGFYNTQIKIAKCLINHQICLYISDNVFLSF